MLSCQRYGPSKSQTAFSFPSTSAKELRERQIEDYLRRLKELPISLEGRGLWSNVDLEALSRRWNLSSYDAAYLDLALRKSVPLATIDHDLKNTAAAQGIEVVS
jgi:predicted nucleic acid-binding protein